MAYKIVDWVYDNVSDSDFKSEIELESSLRAKDIFGRIGGWIENSTDWLNNESAGRRLSDRVIEKNEEYIGEVQTKLDLADTDKELDAIPIDTGYTGETVRVLEDAKQTRLTEIGPDDAVIQAARDAAKGVTSTFQLDELPEFDFDRIQADTNLSTRNAIAEIASEISLDLKDIETEVEESIDLQIEAATTLAQLDRVDTSVAHTTPSENRLNRALDIRRSELEE